MKTVKEVEVDFSALPNELQVILAKLIVGDAPAPKSENQELNDLMDSLNDVCEHPNCTACNPGEPTADSLQATLMARGKRYGPFTGHAEVTQELKESVQHHLAKRDKVLAPDQQEALDMICHKIGRIINGDADYDDSWIDIAGYATLVATRLTSGKEM